MARASIDDIPKQFRLENLKEGLAENYKNFPTSLLGLNPTQMGILTGENNYNEQEEIEVNEETLSALYWYKRGTGLGSMQGMDPRAGGILPPITMGPFSGGGGRGRRPRTSPPDLPSILMDNRVVFIGMPIVKAVAELLTAQLMFLHWYDHTKPVYFYINSTGALNDQGENVAFESDTYAVVDMAKAIKPKIFTVNVGRAFGQAALLLALGEKGFRGSLPHSSVKIYSPKVASSSGPSVEMWTKAYEVEKSAEMYAKFLAESTGKSVEQVRKDIERPKFFLAEDAIEYGIMDKIFFKFNLAKRSYDKEMLGGKTAKQNFKKPTSEAAGVGGM